ncbi:MAG: TonB-dependent receptor [Pseudomonadota bacterium]
MKGKTSTRLRGTMMPEEALRAIVSGSGLVVRRLPNQSLIVIAPTPVQFSQGELRGEDIIVTAPPGRAPGASGGGAPYDIFDEPRTIETVDADEIKKSDLSSVAGAVDSKPNVVVTNEQSPVNFEITVRGISDVGNVNSTAPSTGIFVDGVLLNQVGGSAGFNPSLVDAERVDIFLGPQTTTFGRGTTAGAVNVVTSKPTDEVEVTFEGEVGDFPDGFGSFVLNSPILDDGLLSARVVGFGQVSDGFIDFFYPTVTDQLGDESFGGRLSLRSQPIDDLTLDFQVAYTRTEFDSSSFVTLEILEQSGEFVSFPNPLEKDINEDFITRFEARYETDIGSFSSNTSFRIAENLAIEDGDGLPVDLSQTTVALNTRSFSQEFRYDGGPLELPVVPGSVSFNVGASFNLNEFDTSDTVTFGPAITPLLVGGAANLAATDPAGFAAAAAALGLPADINVVGAVLAALPPSQVGFLDTDDQQDFLNFSLYGDLAWRPIPELELSGGFRYSFDRVETSDQTFTTGPAVALGLLEPSFSNQDEAKFHSISPRASISYDWSDDITTFFAFATGFRPGGISETPTTTIEFNEETTRTFELGFRSRFFQDRLRVNATAFYTEIEDFQTPVTFVFANTLIPPAIVLTNAGDATSYGGELSVTALPTDGLTLNMGAGLNFTEITNFTLSPLGSGGDPVDLSGIDLPNAPEFTLTLSADYEHPSPLVDDLKPFIRADYNLRTDFIGSISAQPTKIDGYDTLDLRLGLRGEKFSIELFGENVLDEVFATSGFPSPSSGLPVPPSVLGAPNAAASPVGVPGRPQRFGLRASVTF